MLDKLKQVNLNTILMLIIIVIFALYLKQCNGKSNLKDEIVIMNMNQLALLDSVTSYKDKSGSLVYEKSALVASKKELKKINKTLYDKVNDLNNNPKIVIRTVTKIVHDTINTKTIVYEYADGSKGLQWDHDTIYNGDSLNYQKLAGETIVKLDGDKLIPIGTKIFTNEVGISFITGLNEGKDSYEIFISSDYPGFKATNIEGAIIDKNMITSNESAIVIGPYIGYGIVFSNGTVGYGVEVGLGITYSLNKPIKKLFSPFGL